MRTPLAETLTLARQGLASLDRRQWLVALASAVGVALLIGYATVLIPNDFFARDIEPVWWNYPVWLLTSALSGLLVATYIKPTLVEAVETTALVEPVETTATDRRTSRLGLAGGILAWFAVGCPVCNKLALLALGYSGAITWFAPIQPFLAIGALALTAVALVVRLRGMVACAVPVRKATVDA
jgi:hypothetical protein